MAYAFRKMTAEEREAAVRERLARGYPLHAPPHPFRGSGRYLLSAVNFEHQPIMAAAERRTDFEERLLTKLKEIEADVYAWVVLPNHYHVLAGVGSLKAVSSALKQLHGATARDWNLADDSVGERQVWYHFHDRQIRGDKHFNRALNYVHYNPVKHGYADSAYDWPWSSLQNYLDAKGRAWLRELWQNFRPSYIGRGWDD